MERRKLVRYALVQYTVLVGLIMTVVAWGQIGTFNPVP